MTTPSSPSQADLRRVLESLPDPFFTLDEHWRLTLINAHGLRLLGRGAAELLGRVFWEVFPETRGTRFETELRRARDEATLTEYEELFAPLGRWLEVRVFPDGDGLGVHYRDVTGRRLAAARAEALAGVAQDLVAAVTAQEVAGVLTGRVREALGAYSAVLYRLEGEELRETARTGLTVPGAWRNVALHGPHLPAVVARDGEARFLREEDFRRHYPGALRAERTRAAAVLPLRARGELLGVLAYSYDHAPEFDEAERSALLTLSGQGALALERARQAGAARDREERYRVLSNVTNDAIWDWEFAGNSVVWNEGAFALFGYAPEEVEPTDRWWKEHLHPDDRGRVVSGIHAVIAGTAREWRDEYRFRRRDGSYATVLDRGQVIRDAGGRATRMIGGMTDLSERERTAELQAESDALSAFAAFTGAAGAETDLTRLAQRAVDTLVQALGDGSAVYYEPGGERWQARAWAGELRGETLDLARRGFALRDLLPDPASPDPQYVEAWAQRGGEVGARTPEYGAAAFFPVAQDGTWRGLLTAGLRAARHWTPRDRAVFEAVAHGLTLAAERTASLGRLEEERAATAAFAAFTERVGTETDLPALARQAVRVLHGAVEGGVGVGYYELEGGHWQARTLAGELCPQVMHSALEGAAAERPEWPAGGVQFVEGGRGGPDGPLAVALCPYLVRGEPRGLLAMASVTHPTWTARARAVFAGVARGLGLAFERSGTARVLQERNAELHARTRALEGFAELARDLAFETDTLALVRRAQQIVLTLLPPGVAVYYEPRGGRWWVRAQTGDVGNPALQAALDAGLPLGEAGNLTQPWRTGQAYYQDAYAPDTDGLAGQTGHIGATATVPILVGGQPQGVFSVALFGARSWDATDRAVLSTAARHLSLALERSAVAAELGRQRQALEATNQELGAFSYTVSHDLRAPLRHIAGFAGMLRRAVETGDAARAARSLDVIDEAVAQAGRLIDALLGFSHLSRQEPATARVDLRRLLGSVRAEAEAEVAGREVEWVVGELPEVRGDPDLLRQVLANLLSNAVKYSARSERLRVEVWGERRPGETVISVRDSGAGFDPRYADRLFGVFQRLHRQEEFGGTGIGLATVRRIVQRHGGRVWAEGQPGEGATFHFSLPEPEALPSGPVALRGGEGRPG
ncbi:PAS domain S-box-containing protein [Deinococcus sp. HSC-46F16]|uniref:ATP-binding protein n=1 Tax=Deinococcus sp. HSC-46F16 TaxID=2910968 RepID=UPI00209EDEB5|nr:ATP-binding protein [Deinococcus sp. HSC-46F16]MCP2014561.1 PAS domain S-box-containing protein [Deinococcus sp. HSC-46F16]